MFFVSFDSEEGRAAYLPHPEHKAFVKVLEPHLDKVLVIDYWTQEIMNRITNLFKQNLTQTFKCLFHSRIPALNDTTKVLKSLEEGGADLVEIGMPYSDPVADGETIQKSNDQALENGMTVKVLFEQLEGIRSTVSLPILLMGYINPVLHLALKTSVRNAPKLV